MNADRRKDIDGVIEKIKAAMTMIEGLQEPIDTCMQEVMDSLESVPISDIKDDEQESFDNLSEGLQQAENGQAMEEAIGNLETADGAVDEVLEKIAEEVTSLTSTLTNKLQEAIDALQSAKGE